MALELTSVEKPTKPFKLLSPHLMTFNPWQCIHAIRDIFLIYQWSNLWTN